MQPDDVITEVRRVLQVFQDRYTARNLSMLDEFLSLFDHGNETELIGIGASVRGRDEWFQSSAQIREIIESDWRYPSAFKIPSKA